MDEQLDFSIISNYISELMNLNYMLKIIIHNFINLML